MGDRVNDRPNVLFVICDDLNNAVASMGRTPFAPAPNLQRLMAGGVSFVNAQNSCPICLPSRSSMLSGLYPHTTGHYTLWDSWQTQVPIRNTAAHGRRRDSRPLLGEAVMFPRHFRESGYRTLGAGKVSHVGNGAGHSSWWTEFGNGSDYGPFIWDAAREKMAAHPDLEWLFEGEPLRAYLERYGGLDRFFIEDGAFRAHIDALYGSMPEVFGSGLRDGLEVRCTGGTAYRYVSDDDRDPLPDEKTAAWAAGKLREKHEDPFFLAVGFMKPHTPLNAPQRFHDMLPLEDIELPPVLAGDCDDCARAHVEHRPYGFLRYGMINRGGEQAWRKWLQSYLACVAFVDEQLGVVLDALEESPCRDNTVVVFTSDNGYHLGEKEFIFKDTLWEESDQIPLIVRAPGVAQEGQVCTRPVSLIDLYPTLTDLCGLPAEPHAATHGHPLEGHSLRPLLENPEAGEWSGPPVALTSVRGNTGIHHAVRSERYRYILCANGEEELYDHESDPHEWHNLAGDAKLAGVKAGLRREMMQLLWKEGGQT